MKRNSIEFLYDILEAISNIQSYVKDIDFEYFQNDSMRYYAVIKNVEIIGEAIKNIDSEILEKVSDPNWKSWKALRDKLAHAYFHIDLRIIWDVIKESSKKLEEDTLLLINQLTFK